MIDCETSDRENRALNLRLRRAKLHQIACMEDIDYRTPRGLNQQQMGQLASCDWIRRQLNVILGPHRNREKLSGLRAGPQGFNACYHRLPRLLEELSIARVD